MRRMHPTLYPHQSSAVESWSDMSNEKNPPYPMPPLVISSWELKWHDQWGGPTLPYCHWSSAVESWSDMSNEEDPPYTISSSVISSWELKWHDQWGGPTLPYPLIGHQQLRVEVTWAMKRTHPTLPHWSSAVESWSDMYIEEDPPYPTPHISHHTAVPAYWDPWGSATLDLVQQTYSVSNLIHL